MSEYIAAKAKGLSERGIKKESRLRYVKTDLICRSVRAAWLAH